MQPIKKKKKKKKKKFCTVYRQIIINDNVHVNKKKKDLSFMMFSNQTDLTKVGKTKWLS